MDGLAQLGRLALTLVLSFCAVWWWVFAWLAMFALAHYAGEALDRAFSRRANEELDRAGYRIIE